MPQAGTHILAPRHHMRSNPKEIGSSLRSRTTVHERAYDASTTLRGPKESS